MAMHIPGLAERTTIADIWSPSNSLHQHAQELYRRPATASNPLYTDLGMWNIYANPDFPNPQANLVGFVCAAGKDCSVDQGLASTIAQFKTPLLRDIVDSSPYLHNGSRDRIEDVLALYIRNSALAKAGKLRNPPPEFSQMSLSTGDISNLTAFLLSLTEDYDDA